MKNIIFLFLFLQIPVLFSQNKLPLPVSKKVISADCKKAIPITLYDNYIYGITVPPKGYGETQEIKSGNKFVFEGEHNTAWYLLTIENEGELIFEIMPKDSSNDYDFLLYAYKDSTFCEKIRQNILQPLRGNLSNISQSVKGCTGLKQNVQNTFTSRGAGSNYSRPLKVKKNEQYMLILDNITPDGKGHRISFSILKEIEIRGKVLNSDSIPVVGEINLFDQQGNSLKETKSDKNGDFAIKTFLAENKNYYLSMVSDCTFVQVKTINTKQLNEKNKFGSIRVVLPKLKTGNKYQLGNINFYGDQAVLLPVSYPSVDGLYKLMKKNNRMIIMIEGHTNGEDWHLSPKDQSVREKLLSKDRAKKIKDYLVEKGINEERIATTGLGSTQPLFKQPVNESQSSANRRVEIKILSIK